MKESVVKTIRIQKRCFFFSFCFIALVLWGFGYTCVCIRVSVVCLFKKNSLFWTRRKKNRSSFFWPRKTAHAFYTPTNKYYLWEEALEDTTTTRRHDQEEEEDQKGSPQKHVVKALSLLSSSFSGKKKWCQCSEQILIYSWGKEDAFSYNRWWCVLWHR